jgi:hypothetical protein
MKTIIAGSRSIVDYETLIKAIQECPWNISEVVSGKAKGVDTLGEKYAKENNKPLLEYPANWKLYGKSAGYKRNVEMAEKAEALLAIWNGESKGTKHMIDIAKAKGLSVHVVMITKSVDTK